MSQRTKEIKREAIFWASKEVWFNVEIALSKLPKRSPALERMCDYKLNGMPLEQNEREQQFESEQAWYDFLNPPANYDGDM